MSCCLFRNTGILSEPEYMRIGQSKAVNLLKEEETFGERKHLKISK